MRSFINKRIEGVIPDLAISGISLERVQNFNFLGLLLNENISWKLHIDLLANKLGKCAGVLNNLKDVLPIHIFMNTTWVWFNIELCTVY